MKYKCWVIAEAEKAVHRIILSLIESSYWSKADNYAKASSIFLHENDKNSGYWEGPTLLHLPDLWFSHS